MCSCSTYIRTYGVLCINNFFLETESVFDLLTVQKGCWKPVDVLQYTNRYMSDTVHAFWNGSRLVSFVLRPKWEWNKLAKTNNSFKTIIAPLKREKNDEQYQNESFLITIQI